MDLKVKVSADIKDLISQLDKGGITLEQFGKQVGKTTSQLGTQVKKGSNDASFALQNLGRVAQDAPFGFIGIANNLNPLLESFQRLKQSSGGLKGALTALGSSLMGAGGIGLALSAFQFFALGGVEAITKFFKSASGGGKALEEAKKATEEFNKALKDAESGAIATGLKLQSFVNIAKDVNAPLEKRNEALREANKIMGEHGEKLTLVNIATAAVTEQINKFTQATIQQTLANKFSDRAADLIIAQREAASAYGKELAKLNELERKKQTYITSKGEEQLTAEGAATIKQRDKVFELTAAYKQVTKDLKDVTGQMSTAQQVASTLFGEIGHKDKEKATKTIKTVSDVLREMREDVAAINFQFDQGFLNIKERDQQLLQRYNAALKELFDLKQKVGSKSVQTVVTDLEPVIDRTQLAERMKEKVETVAKQLPQIGQSPIVIPLNAKPSITFKEELLHSQLIAFNKKLQEILTAALTDTFSGIGESIGNLLSGDQSLGEAFGMLFSTIGNYVQQLGKYMISISPLVQAVQAAISSLNPAGMLVGGIALVALGQLMKSLPKFATGVTGFGGGMALVGERGPEIVRLPSGSDVIPNHRLTGLSGGEGGFVASTSLRGSDILILIERAQNQRGRIG